MNATVWSFEYFLSLPFFGIGEKKKTVTAIKLVKITTEKMKNIILSKFSVTMIYLPWFYFLLVNSLFSNIDKKVDIPRISLSSNLPINILCI